MAAVKRAAVAVGVPSRRDRPRGHGMDPRVKPWEDEGKGGVRLRAEQRSFLEVSTLSICQAVFLSEIGRYEEVGVSERSQGLGYD